MRFLKWKNRSLTRGLFSAGGRVLVLLLCLCFALSSYLPASALDFDGGMNTYAINGLTTSNCTQNYTDYSTGNSLRAGVICNGRYLQSLVIRTSSSIPANSLVYVTMSVTGAGANDAPLAFTGSQFAPVVWSSISGDNQNYTVAGLFYYASADNNVNLYFNVQNWNFNKGTSIVHITVSKPVSFKIKNSAGLTASDLNNINTRLNNINTDIWNIYENTEAIADDTAGIRDDIYNTRQAVSAIQSAIGDLSTQQQATNDKLDRQWQQEQDDRDDLTDQQQDISDDADDSAQQAETTGTTLLGAFSSFVGALTNASPTNCVIDMDMGNLDLGEVDLCQLSPPQPIPTIASIMLIAFCVPLSLATATKMINLFRSFTG